MGGYGTPHLKLPLIIVAFFFRDRILTRKSADLGWLGDLCSPVSLILLIVVVDSILTGVLVNSSLVFSIFPFAGVDGVLLGMTSACSTLQCNSSTFLTSVPNFCSSSTICSQFSCCSCWNLRASASNLCILCLA